MWMLINLKDLICASRCDLWHPIRYFSILLPRRLNQSCSVVKESPITKFSPVDRPTDRLEICSSECFNPRGGRKGD